MRHPFFGTLGPCTLVMLMAACGGGEKGTGPTLAGSLTAQSGLTPTGRAGLFPADTPIVIVKSASGTPLAGVPVVFTVVSGGGSVINNGASAASATITSNASGLAGLRWRFGGTLGAQVLQAKVDTFPAVLFTATVTAGNTAQLLVILGNNQTAAANVLLPVAPKVQAKDSFGNVVPGDTIDFTSTLGTNTLTAARQVTDAGGFATLGSWTLGACGGQSTVTATSHALGAPAAALNATVTGGGNYCIELVYTATPDAALKVNVENAAARWNRVITSALSIENVTSATFSCAGITGLSLTNRNVKSVLIYVQLAPITSTTPGLVTLGSAGPCFLRSTNGLTVVGGLRLNSDYLLNNVSNLQREDVVLHEMGHVLGFGTLWQGSSTIPGLPAPLANPAGASGVGNPIFVGTAALTEYLAIGGPAGSPGVPVENCGGAGTINSHWREGVAGGGAGSGFGTELMTGYASAPAGQRNPFSRVTIAAMQDMGYGVDLSQADPYTLNSQACPVPLLIAPPGSIVIGHDVVREELASPTHVVRNGRVERIVWR